jgi:hypothetical protein
MSPLLPENRLLRWLIGAAALIATLAGLVFLIPLSSFAPRIEAAASEATGQPVRIDSLRLMLLPRPHLRVAGIRVGKAEEIKVAAVEVTPALSSLASKPVVLDLIEIEGLAAPIEALGLLAGGATQKAGDEAAVRVQRARLREAKLVSGGKPLGPIDADVALDAAGRPVEISVASGGGRLTLESKPAGETLQLMLKAKDFTLPAGAPIRFDELDAQGEMAGSRLAMTKIVGRLYGGTLDARLQLDWTKNWQLGGNLGLQGVALEPLLALFANEKKLGGRLDTKAKLAANAREAGRLADVLRIDGNFVVRDGVLYDVDLANAATLVGGSKTRGGDTKFDELTGLYHVTGKAYRLERLRVVSGLLNASGDVEVSPSNQLAGKLYVEMKTGVSLVQVPLRVAGTMQDPLLYPTGAAVAGAAVGTGVLGPGAGTSLGSRIGDAIENLFGGRK